MFLHKKTSKKGRSAKILITGGHSTPALACIEELSSRGYKNFYYVGQKRSILFDKNFSAEYRVVSGYNDIKFYSLVAGKLSLTWDLHSVVWVMRLPIGFIHALALILRIKPDIILSFGSHVALPICFWSYLLKIPIIIHEQTTTVGRTNKFLQSIADRICLSWDFDLGEYDERYKHKYVITGNPVRSEIFNVKSNKFNFADGNKKIILIMGGNQGSHAINEFIFANIESLVDMYNVIHQTGSNTVYNDHKRSIEIAKEINSSGTRYIPVDYILPDEIGEAYSKADLIISRAGANTVVEIILLRKKCILIPIPTTSGNEQFKNSLILEKAGLGKTILQKDLRVGTVLEAANYLLNECKIDLSFLDRLTKMHTGSVGKIVDVLEGLLGQ